MRTRLLLILFVILAAGGTWYWTRAPAETAEAAPGRGRGRGGQDPTLPVPVVEGKAVRQDVPVYLTGLGSVAAFNTVTVRSRVDGRLDKVLFREGQDVKAGDVLAQIDPRPLQAALNQATALLHKDEALLANSRADLQRYTQLAAQQFSSRQSLDTQKATVAQGAAAVEGDRAAVESAKVQLGYTTITSPIDGRTGIRQIDQGNIIHAADLTGLVVVTQLDPISVIFALPEANILAVNDALAKGPMAVTALARDTETVLAEGTLALVDNQIDATTGTVKLKATFANQRHRLWPGQFVNARLLLTVRQGGTTVPAAVVQRGPQGTFAYRIKPDGTVEMRPVKVAQSEAGLALVESGLEPGDRVVVDGQYRLQNGSHVTPVAPGALAAAPAS